MRRERKGEEGKRKGREGKGRRKAADIVDEIDIDR